MGTTHAHLSAWAAYCLRAISRHYLDFLVFVLFYRNVHGCLHIYGPISKSRKKNLGKHNGSEFTFFVVVVVLGIFGFVLFCF